MDLAKHRKGSLLDPLGLFQKNQDPQSASKSGSLGTNLMLGPLSLSSSIATSSATAHGNGASSVAKANSQAIGGANANADATAAANAQGI